MPLRFTTTLKLFLTSLALCALLIAPALAAAPAASDAMTAKEPPASVEGKILKAKKKKVTVTLAAGPLPRPGQEGTLLKYFKKGILSGWIVIATVKVSKVKGRKVGLKILKRKSAMRVNGKKVNHFTKGARIKLSFG